MKKKIAVILAALLCCVAMLSGVQLEQRTGRPDYLGGREPEERHGRTDDEV